MGTRGHLGGLAEATLQSLLLLDAAGKDVVFLETVGTGQSEVEVMSIADEVLLVLMPGSGDSVQALKAGIMEIPDVIAINKMDQPGAKAMLNDIRAVIVARPRGGAPARDRPHRGAARGRRRRRSGARSSIARDALDAGGELEERRRRNLAGEVVAAATARARAGIEARDRERPGAGRARRRRAAARDRPADRRRPDRLDRCCARRVVTRARRWPTSWPPASASRASRGSRRCSRRARSAASSGRVVTLKAENLQLTGSFKIRGAYNTIAQLTEAERDTGVVTASAGNHGQAVAWAARQAGIAATIFVPEGAPMAKVDAARGYGADGRAGRRGLRRRGRRRRASTSRRPARPSSTPSTTRASSRARGRSGSSWPSSSPPGRARS